MEVYNDIFHWWEHLIWRAARGMYNSYMFLPGSGSIDPPQNTPQNPYMLELPGASCLGTSRNQGLSSQLKRETKFYCKRVDHFFILYLIFTVWKIIFATVDSKIDDGVLCGPWARHIYPSLVLVQPRKTHPCLTERSLMGRKASKQTKKSKIDENRCKQKI